MNIYNYIYVLLDVHTYMYVCLCQQMKYCCGEAGSVAVIPSQLVECFMSYMEKLSVTQYGIVVIVIDNADIIQVSVPNCIFVHELLQTPVSQNIS